ncbi:MAG: CinA family protein [Methanobacteriota archaeon]|nr:MAG: CinA family protein [Euryarchaeota archaeon]
MGEKLGRKGFTLALAESCTGGKLGDIVTEVPGSSVYFLGGVVSYSDDAKVEMLGVDRAVIESKGAVSEEVARMMADGARMRFGADVGVGITGIAGPTGATSTKPVGLVFIAVASEASSTCVENRFTGSRSEVKCMAAEKAVLLLDEFLDSI